MADENAVNENFEDDSALGYEAESDPVAELDVDSEAEEQTKTVERPRTAMPLSTDDEFHWYIIHVRSTYEMKVKTSLERLRENNGLQDQIADVKVPRDKTPEIRNGKQKIVETNIYPSYVFIKMRYNDELAYWITNTNGVTSFLGPGGRALPMTDDEVYRMGLEDTPVETSDFAVGDSVVVVNGPLVNYEGVIKEINKVSKKAKVNVPMFNRDTEVEVELNQIKKKR